MKVIETLVVNPKYINFGTVLEGEEYKKTITLLNKGKKTIQVTNMTITPFTQIELNHVGPFVLSPGGIKTFTLTFKPKLVKNGFIYGAAVFKTDLDYPSKVVVHIYAHVQRNIN